MISWQPHPPALSDTASDKPAGAPSGAIPELLLLDQTAAFVVPPPAELAAPRRHGATLLAELCALEPLRSPLIHKLAAIVRRLGADDRELVALARELWVDHARRNPGMSPLELGDVPSRRPTRAFAAVELCAVER